MYGSWFGHKDYTDRWQKAGDEAGTNVPSMPADPVSDPNRDNFYLNSEALVEKQDHIRLQDISLSYTIGKNNWKKNPFTSIRVYGYVNNIGILWRANDEGLDPDVNGGYPSFRTVTFGVKLGL